MESGFLLGGRAWEDSLETLVLSVQFHYLRYRSGVCVSTKKIS